MPTTYCTTTQSHLHARGWSVTLPGEPTYVRRNPFSSSSSSSCSCSFYSSNCCWWCMKIIQLDTPRSSVQSDEHSMLTHHRNETRRWSHWLVGRPIKGDAVRAHSTQCAAMSDDPQDTYRSVVVALLCSGLYILGDAIARHLIQQSLFEVWLH